MDQVDAADGVTPVRAAHDPVAEGEAELRRTAPAGSPYERAMLAVLAEQVTADGGGPVADVGCGSGLAHRL